MANGSAVGADDLQLTVSSDNAYELYVNGQLVGSGSNWQQAGSYTVPLQSGENVVAVKGMDAGGVAGFIASLSWSGGSAVSDGSWKVSTTTPTDGQWTNVGFDDSGWASPTSYGSYGVGPWGTRVSGFPAGTGAQWIWSADNDADNTVYLRYRIMVGDGTVNTPPEADFSVACTDLTCTFTDASSDNVTIASWSWDFGDGGTSTEQSPEHTYAVADTYSVSLTVADDAGATNTLSKEVTVASSGDPTDDLQLTLSSDNAYELYVNGQLVGSGSNWQQAGSYTVPLQSGENVVAVKGMDAGGVAGFIASLSWSGGSAVSDGSWKVSTTTPTDGQWTNVGFDDSGWASPTSYGSYGVGPWGTRVSGFPAGTGAQWIWSADNNADNTVYLRYRIMVGDGTVNTPPEADFSVACTDLTCTFTDASSDNVTIASWSWDFGDGGTSTEQSPEHTYAVADTYSVSLTVADDAGATNTLSKEVTVASSGDPTDDLQLTLSSDNAYELYVNGQLVGSGSNWQQAGSYTVPLQSGENVVAVKGMDAGGVAGFIASLSWSGGSAVSDGSWKVSTTTPTDGQWTNVGFDDSGWASPTSYGSYGVGPWGTRVSGFPAGTGAQWIWSADNDADNTVYLRFNILIP